jgi:hypothetical protein
MEAEELLECAICFGLLRDPCTLPCGEVAPPPLRSKGLLLTRCVWAMHPPGCRPHFLSCVRRGAPCHRYPPEMPAVQRSSALR